MKQQQQKKIGGTDKVLLNQSGKWKIFFKETKVYEDPVFDLFCNDMVGGDKPEAFRFIINNYIRLFLLPKYISVNIDTSEVKPSKDFFVGFFDTVNNEECFLKAVANEYNNEAIIAIKDMVDKYLRFYGLKRE
jgi:hypothetical protein